MPQAKQYRHRHCTGTATYPLIFTTHHGLLSAHCCIWLLLQPYRLGHAGALGGRRTAMTPPSVVACLALAVLLRFVVTLMGWLSVAQPSSMDGHIAGLVCAVWAFVSQALVVAQPLAGVGKPRSIATLYGHLQIHVSRHLHLHQA